MDKEFLIHPLQITGKSTKIYKVLKEIKRLAKKEVPVIISGENGTYKELIAKAIHYSSKRQDGPFIELNLASIPVELTEEELFGYERSSSKLNTISKIEQADRGTLFIDEISEMNMNLQEKILLFLKTKEFKHVNSSNILKSDVRVVGATSKNLRDIVNKGHFRKDLFEIFSSTHIKVPPLRERKEDILLLAKYFLDEVINKFETGPKELSKDARDFLVKHNWPGNIRELEKTIKKATILSNTPVITKKDLMIEDFGSCSMREFLEGKLKRYLKDMSKLENCNLHETVLSEVEKSLIGIVLKETGYNQLRTARILGINRNTLRAKIKEYKIRK